MKEFREFLEKRWWQGIGGIAGIAALVLVVLQFLGIVHISGIAVSIAVNIILAITLALVATRATKWKRKYEHVSSELEKIKGLVERQKEASKPKRVLLPNSSSIWKLSLDNVLLNELYGQAYGRAASRYHDAKLCGFTILVFPHGGDKVSILFHFCSQWAGRECTFIISEIGDMEENLPNKPIELGATFFGELPWIQCPNWPEFLRLSCEKAHPLSPARWSNYMLLVTVKEGKLRWSISFEDGVTGETSWFRWDGKSEPIPREEHG